MSVTKDDVIAIVRQVRAEEKEHQNASVDAVVLQTISTILTSFGIDDEDRKEIRADLTHLRRWRKSVEQVERVGFTTLVGIIVSGLAGAVWLGFKMLVTKSPA